MVDVQQRTVCEQCGVNPAAYDGARFCGAACSQEHEMGTPKSHSRAEWLKAKAIARAFTKKGPES